MFHTVWGMLANCFVICWELFGNYLGRMWEGFTEMFGCLGIIWEIFGNCLGTVCELFGKDLETCVKGLGSVWVGFGK